MDGDLHPAVAHRRQVFGLLWPGRHAALVAFLGTAVGALLGARDEAPLDRTRGADAVIARREPRVRIRALRVLLGHSLPDVGIGRAHDGLEAAVEGGEAAVREHACPLLQELGLQLGPCVRLILLELLDATPQLRRESFESAALAQQVDERLAPRGRAATLGGQLQHKLELVHTPSPRASPRACRREPRPPLDILAVRGEHRLS